MQVRIIATGFVQAISAVKLVGEGGKAVNGSIATFGSTLPYARPIETGMRGGRMWRHAGPALMFQKGVAETVPQAGPILLAAIPKGAASVGQAKRKIRDIGTANIQKYTPVRTGALRASVRALERPG